MNDCAIGRLADCTTGTYAMKLKIIGAIRYNEM